MSTPNITPMTIYHCHACRYTFPAITPDRCPDCGAYTVRPATEEQVKDYERIKREIADENDIQCK